MLDNRRIELGKIDPKDLPNGVRYIGHLNKPNLDIYSYGEVYLDNWTDPATPSPSGWWTTTRSLCCRLIRALCGLMR